MKRLKRILQWTGVVVVGLAAIGLVANAVFVWTTDTRLEQQLAAIRAAGDPLTLADLAHPPIPPEKNAATYLRRAEADVAAIDKEVMSPEVISLTNNGNMPYPLPPKVRKTIRAALDAYPKAIPLLQEAAACTDFDAQLDYSRSSGQVIAQMLPVVQALRGHARVLRYRACLLVAEENRDEAVRTALMLFRLAHHCERNPALVGYLVAITLQGMAVDSANLVLQAGPVAKGVRDALDAALARQEGMEGYTWALKSERVFALDTFRDMVPGRNFWLIGRGYWNRQEYECLALLDAYVALTLDPRPYRQTDRVIRKAYSQAGQNLSNMSQLIIPAIEAAHQAVTRIKAETRALRVLNALQTHVPAGSHETPKLSELGLPADATADPFTGEPLRVKKTPQGWIVYSVGPNYQDDGGKLDDPLNGDVGVGPPPPVAKPGEK